MVSSGISPHNLGELSQRFESALASCVDCAESGGNILEDIMDCQLPISPFEPNQMLVLKRFLE
jgi:hypothetical protein